MKKSLKIHISQRKITVQFGKRIENTNDTYFDEMRHLSKYTRHESVNKTKFSFRFLQVRYNYVDEHVLFSFFHFFPVKKVMQFIKVKI